VPLLRLAPSFTFGGAPLAITDRLGGHPLAIVAPIVTFAHAVGKKLYDRLIANRLQGHRQAMLETIWASDADVLVHAGLGGSPS